MKKAFIVTEEFNGKKIGDIFSIDSAEHIDSLVGNFYSTHMVKVIVPVDLENKPQEVLKSYLSESGNWSIILDAVKEASLIKQVALGQAYNQMNFGVYAEIPKVFNTNQAESALTNYLTWMLMSAKPQSFSSSGLKCWYPDIIGIQLNEPLDTDAKIKNYADQLLERAEDWCVWRMVAIQTFLNAKEAIESPT